MDPMLMTQPLTVAPQMLLNLGNQLAPLAWVATAYAGVTVVAIVGSLLRLDDRERPSLTLPRPTLRIALGNAGRRLDEAA